MGYTLLWIEGLAFWLLLVALVAACAARLEGRRWQRTWPESVLLLVVLPSAALSALFGWYAAMYPIHTWLFAYNLSWTVACGLLGAWVIFRGLRPAEASAQTNAEPRARSWRRGQFVTWLAFVLIVYALTLFFVDKRVRSALNAINAKALQVARDLEPAMVPDGQNAAKRYAAAAESVGKFEPFSEKFGRFDSEDFDPNQPALAPALQERQAALADVREASKLPAWYENRKLIQENWMVTPNMTHLMDLAQFLSTDARVKAAAGDAAGALDDLAAIKRIAAHVSRHPTLVSQMFAIAIDSMTAQIIEPILSEATPLSPKLIALPVAVPGVERKNWVRAWQFEKAYFRFVATQDPRTARGPGPYQPGVLEFSFYYVFMGRQELAELQKHHDRFILVAGQPYHVSREARTQMERPDTRRGMLSTVMVSNLTDAFKAFTDAQAAARLYALTLAAAAFQARTGRYPQSAAELIPAYIAEIPTDPFSGKPLRLKPVPDGLILYSVGSDGEDNGGKRGAEHLYAEEGEDIVFQLGAAYKK